MHREYHKWYSPALNRDMELLIFGHAGARVLVFPTRDGRFFDYENWGQIQALTEKIENGWLQLYCLDSIDAESLYCCWCRPQDRIKRHLQYEAYILNEVIPLTHHKNPNSCLIAHGCSLGAYHAVNLAFRHPHLFAKVVAFSGRYDLTATIGSFRDLFDGHYDENVYYNMPCHFIPNMGDNGSIEQLRHLDIVLVIGEEDQFFENNKQLSHALWEKGIWNALHIWHGEAHKPRHWRKMAALYL